VPGGEEGLGAQSAEPYAAGAGSLLESQPAAD